MKNKTEEQCGRIRRRKAAGCLSLLAAFVLLISACSSPLPPREAETDNGALQKTENAGSEQPKNPAGSGKKEDEAVNAESSSDPESESAETTSDTAVSPETTASTAPLSDEEKALKLKEELPAEYNCFSDTASPEATFIFDTFFDDLDEAAKAQGRRNPPVIEYLVRRDLPKAKAAAHMPEGNPFADEPLPYFMQWDQRWAFDDYADGQFGQTGCGPAALSMVYTGLTGRNNYLPDEMGKFATFEGYATPDNGTSWTLMSEGAEKLGLTVEELPLHKPSMVNALEEGRPIILILGPGDFTASGHYIVLRSWNGEAFDVYDPFNLQNSLKSWTYEEIEDQIRNIWAYSY